MNFPVLNPCVEWQTMYIFILIPNIPQHQRYFTHFLFTNFGSAGGKDLHNINTWRKVEILTIPMQNEFANIRALCWMTDTIWIDLSKDTAARKGKKTPPLPCSYQGILTASGSTKRGQLSLCKLPLSFPIRNWEICLDKQLCSLLDKSRLSKF